jgi:hypothetical protein
MESSITGKGFERFFDFALAAAFCFGDFGKAISEFDECPPSELNGRAAGAGSIGAGAASGATCKWVFGLPRFKFFVAGNRGGTFAPVDESSKKFSGKRPASLVAGERYCGSGFSTGGLRAGHCCASSSLTKNDPSAAKTIDKVIDWPAEDFIAVDSENGPIFVSYSNRSDQSGFLAKSDLMVPDGSFVTNITVKL